MIFDRKTIPETKYEKEHIAFNMLLNKREMEFILKLLDKEFDGSEESRLIESLTTTIRGGIKEVDGIKEYTWAELHLDRV
jgi:hypothetical protein